MLGAACLAATSPAAIATSNTAITIAGDGIGGWLGDGGPAVYSRLYSPWGIARLADGSILVADYSNHRIRKISSTGVITTVVGTGVQGYAGDGGSAQLARLNQPTDIAVAPDGVTFYIADSANRRVRRVDASGVITTVAGTGTDSSTGDFGPASSATLRLPGGLGVAASGDLYIADTNAHRVRHVFAGGGLVSGAETIETVAGNGTQAFAGDNGPATAASLSAPYDVLPISGGEVLIADYSNGRVREVDAFGVIRTVVGGGPCAGALGTCGDGGLATNAFVSRPVALATDGAGGYLVVDDNYARIRHVNASSIITTVFGDGTTCDGRTICGDGGSAETAALWVPRGVVAAPDGTIYVSDFNQNRIRARVLDPEPTGPTGGQGPAGSSGPQGPAGTVGAAGTSGANGGTGADGARGSDGVNGSTGARGANGSGPGLAVSLAASRISLRAKQRDRVRAFVSSAAELTAVVYKRGRRVRTLRRSVKRAGIVRIAVGSLRRGDYRLVVTASAGDQRSQDRTTLRVR